MCGIAGFWDQRSALQSDAMPAVLRRMTDAIHHRGPDDEGAWIDAPRGIALGHRRLSVIDVSPAGHQPMASADGRFQIVYNGEIYNYEALRADLEREGCGPWRGHSDTEVLLAAIGRWGLRRALERTVGMFAIALWDTATRTLALARDRLGEKPLYYGWHRGTLLFGSELKAIRAFDGWSGELDRAAVASYLQYGYVPAPRSIHANVGKVPPAHIVVVREAGKIDPPQPYWSAQDATEHPAGGRLNGTEAELADELERVLRAAVAGQMVADVPLGAFLSGGVDSSTIVALMQAQSTRPVRTFSIGFHEQEYDEARYAREVARHLRTDHTELIVQPADAMAVIPKLGAMYDEPFADSSQIPTFLVAQMARRHVTVALSGDAGDELFAGYNRYAQARGARRLARLPVSLRRGVAAAIRAGGPATVRQVARLAEWALPPRMQVANPVEKAFKLADVLALPDLPSFYRRVVAMWPQPAEIMPGAPPPPDAPAIDRHFARFESGAEAMMAMDLVTYLPDDILVKVDRAAMAVSLETRVPLLDHRVVEFAWRTPIAAKLSEGTTKRLLRSVLYRYVPPALIERPKMGFGIPIDRWLRGPLRDWAEQLLAVPRLQADGIFDATAVRRTWQQHLDGHPNLQYRLWTVLMFQAWREATP